MRLETQPRRFRGVRWGRSGSDGWHLSNGIKTGLNAAFLVTCKRSPTPRIFLDPKTSSGSTEIHKIPAKTSSAVALNHSFLIIPLPLPLPATSTPRRNLSNASSAGKDFVKVALWRFTRFCTWRSRRTSVPCATAASINARTSRLIC